MPARPATIDDIPEVLRLAALMYATIGQRADEEWFREAGRLLETRMGEGRTGVFVASAPCPMNFVPKRPVFGPFGTKLVPQRAALTAGAAGERDGHQT